MRAAIYCRLSKDDGDSEGDSSSIQTQRAMLEHYCVQQGWEVVAVYQDDGKSGTNYDRPGWQELMAKVDADEVGTIILKSLDRMGRNYLESGVLRELFAEKGIRLIAVNDGIDTFDREDDFVPFREIMAEYYARDTSRKIKSVIHAKGRDGKPMTCTVPYGFVKDPEDKERWLVDSEAAEVVRRIYALTIEGNGPYQIAKKLFEDKVERPSYYLAKRGIGSHQANCNMDTPYTWNGEAVAAIIARPEYAGHMVNFRTTKPSFKSKKFKKNDPSEWLIFPNTHEAIVPQETWDLAQSVRNTKRRVNETGEANPLTGLLYCHDCGARMYNHRNVSEGRMRVAKNGKEYRRSKDDSYKCSCFANSKVKFAPTCTEHTITTKVVREILLEAIRATAGYVREHEQAFIEQLRESSAVKANETAKLHRKLIAKYEKRLAELDKIFYSLYEDKALHKITEAMFEQMSGKYTSEREELAARNAELQAELGAFESDGTRADKFIELVQKYTRFEELTTPMIFEFIERVEIHEGVWSDLDPERHTRGSRTQEVDVYLKYIGKYSPPAGKTQEELEAEEKRVRFREKRREYERRYLQKKYGNAPAAVNA
jgi:DNA invertase Pin-like site-specific DNA recombinase